MLDPRLGIGNVGNSGKKGRNKMQFGNWTYDGAAKVLTHRDFPGY